MTPADLGLIGHDAESHQIARHLGDEGYHILRLAADCPQPGNAAGMPCGSAQAFCKDMETLVSRLSPPRRVFIRAGSEPELEAIVQRLIPLLSEEDLIVDLGDSYFLDTERRACQVQSEGLRFLGVAISHDSADGVSKPGFVIGGDPRAFNGIKPLLDAMARRTENGGTCADFIGPRGAGHFTGMVCKGLVQCEHALLLEAGNVMMNLDAARFPEMLALFRRKDPVSMLLEALCCAPSRDGSEPAVNEIRIRSDQIQADPKLLKHARDLGTPLPVLSAIMESSKEVGRAGEEKTGLSLVDDLWTALNASRIVAWRQSMEFFDKASVEFNYFLNLPAILNIWQQSTWLHSALIEKILPLYEARQVRFGLQEALAGSLRKSEAREAWQRISRALLNADAACPGLAAAMADVQ